MFNYFFHKNYKNILFTNIDTPQNLIRIGNENHISYIFPTKSQTYFQTNLPTILPHFFQTFPQIISDIFPRIFSHFLQKFRWSKFGYFVYLRKSVNTFKTYMPSGFIVFQLEIKVPKTTKLVNFGI